MKNEFRESTFSEPSLELLQQDFDAYTSEDYKVWEILLNRQLKNLPELAARGFIEGFNALGFSTENIVNLKSSSLRLKVATGWSIQVVSGVVGEELFFSLLQRKKFPVTSRLRKLGELDYLLSPDLFHDGFGHLPLLMDAHYARFLQRLAETALRFIDNPLAMELLSRVYWYTVEFGLIRENNEIKVYGAGILSSSGEMQYCLSKEPKHYDYDVEAVLNTPYWKNKFQERYFIINSFKELYLSIPEIEEKLEELLQKA